MSISNAMKKLAELFQIIDGRKYFVKRGAINWASFPFDKYPLAISLQVDEIRFLNPSGIIPVSISIEIASKMKEVDELVPEIDDNTINQMVDDTQSVLIQWVNGRDSDNNPYVLKIGAREASAIEFHDPSLLVQGIVVALSIDV